MKTAEVTISKAHLKRLVAEEIQKINEEVDHEGVRTVVNAASKLLKAASAFKEDMTGAMTNAVTPHLDHIMKALENMVSNPSSYVDVPKKEPRRIKFRRVDSE